MAFETFLTHDKQTPKRKRRLTYLVSLAAHGALLSVGVAYSFGHVDELIPKSVPLVFLSAPPPPPPPAAAAARKTTPRVKQRPVEVTQPDEIVPPKEEPRKEESTGTKDGVVGGKEHGVKDGVLNGVIGGFDKGPQPATFLPPNVARGQLAIDPQAEPYRVKLPPALATAGMALWAMVRVCVRRDGSVGEVKIVKSADPVLDPVIVATLQGWRYRPYTVNDRPVPFCTNVRYEITTR